MQQLANLKHDPKLNLGFGNDSAPKIEAKAKSIPIDLADRVESANPRRVIGTKPAWPRL